MWSSIIGAAGNILSGALGGWYGRSNANAAAKYQYDLNQRSLRESPTATREGLEAAGYNPMLAISQATAAPTVGMPDASSGTNAVSNASRDMMRSLINKETDKADAEIDAIRTNAKSQQTTANAAAVQASAADRVARANSARMDMETVKIGKEAAGIDPKTQKENAKYRTWPAQLFTDIVRGVKSAYGLGETSSAFEDRGVIGARNELIRQAKPVIKRIIKAAGDPPSTTPPRMRHEVKPQGTRPQDDKPRRRHN